MFRCRAHIPQNAWRLFALASRYNDKFLARACLAKLDHDPEMRTFTLASMKLSAAKCITLPYLVALIRSMSSGNSGHYNNHRQSWSNIAEAFDPEEQ